MKVSFATARRINLAIRGVAAVIAAVPVPFVVVVLVILGFWWGVDFTVSGIFGSFQRFFVRLFSGHTADADHVVCDERSHTEGSSCCNTSRLTNR